MKQIQITIPIEPEERMMGVLTILRDDFKMKNLISLQGIKNCLIIFRCEGEALSDVLNDLSKLGIGSTYGIIDVLDLALSFPEESVIKTMRPEFERRISVTEIQNTINKSTSSTFNYILFIILASVTAGCGLIMSSAAIVIASMIISPLMAPILSMTFGIIIRDKRMITRGLTFQLYGLFIAVTIGWILGLLSDELGYVTEPTNEMLLRNYPGVLSYTAGCMNCKLVFQEHLSESSVVELKLFFYYAPQEHGVAFVAELDLVLGVFKLSL